LASRMKIGNCWDFNDDEQPPYPTIKVTLSSADREATISPKVDTGFNGWLAVGAEAMRKLRLTSRGTVLVRAATGHGSARLCCEDLSSRLGSQLRNPRY